MAGPGAAAVSWAPLPWPCCFPCPPWAPSRQAREASHTYCAPGTYTITATADEGAGVGLSGKMPYTIQGVGPTPPIC